jgi:hypothetical protein
VLDVDDKVNNVPHIMTTPVRDEQGPTSESAVSGRPLALDRGH